MRPGRSQRGVSILFLMYRKALGLHRAGEWAYLTNILKISLWPCVENERRSKCRRLGTSGEVYAVGP